MTKSEFINGVSNWDNHRLLLWPALEATKHLNLPVLELGCGDGSTPYLCQYCEDNNLQFFSYDSSEQWALKFGSIFISDWNLFPWSKEFGVTLVDESPGEHRKESIAKLNSKVIVAHDSEIEGWNSSDYKIRPLFNKFKYVKDLESVVNGGAWASVLSNDFDVTKFEP